MKYALVVATALLLFAAALQLTTKGPNPNAEALAIDVRPAALKLAEALAVAGTPQYREYEGLAALANSTQAQQIRSLAYLVQSLNRDMSSLASAVAAGNKTAASIYYASAQSRLAQIRTLLTQMGLWESAKGYYLSAYAKLEAYRQALENKTPAVVEVYAPEAVEAGGTARILAETRPPNGTLLVYLDGVLTNTTRTGRAAEIAVRIAAYKPSVNITVAYIPDDPHYSAAVNTTAIKVIYYNSTLELQCPGEVQWGGTLYVRGRTDSAAPLVAIRIGDVVENFTTAGGAFEAELNTSMLAPGRHKVTAYLPPSGMYSPASATCLVNITAEAPQARVPALLVAGVPTPITGYYAYTPGPLVPTGPAHVVIYVPPHYPYSAAEIEADVFVVNPIQIATAAGLAAALAAMLRRRRAAGPPDLKPADDYAALAARYIREAAARAGISLTPGATIREVLAALRARNEELYERLARIGRRLEEVLYAGEEPTPEDYEELRR
ncbi:MAG: DUF4129 domain-containing protein [Thermoproteus sp.]